MIHVIIFMDNKGTEIDRKITNYKNYQSGHVIFHKDEKYKVKRIEVYEDNEELAVETVYIYCYHD